MRFASETWDSLVPLTLRALFHSLSARVTIASLLGSIPFALQTSLHSFSASLITVGYDFLIAEMKKGCYENLQIVCHNNRLSGALAIA
jgi:hypothetical protein